MNIALFTVSAMNHIEEHSEWLFPFYSSLKTQITNNDLGIDHYIILNERSKEDAKNNIEEIIQRFDIKSYDHRFLESSIQNTDGIGTHHGESLYWGFNYLQKEKIDKYDYFLVEEFDVIHCKNYAEFLFDLIEYSKKYKSFIGSIYSGKFEKNDNSEKFYISLPRILPYFLGVPPFLFIRDLREGDKNHFTSFESRKKCLEIRESCSGVEIYSDTNTDLFFEIMRDVNFFSINELNSFLYHIKAVSTRFHNAINKYEKKPKPPEYYENQLSNKFEYVKNNFDLEFKEKSPLFKKNQYSQNLEKYRK